MTRFENEKEISKIKGDSMTKYCRKQKDEKKDRKCIRNQIHMKRGKRRNRRLLIEKKW